LNLRFLWISALFIILMFLFSNPAIAVVEEKFSDGATEPTYENQDKAFNDAPLGLSISGTTAFTGVTEAVHDVTLGLSVPGTIDKIFFHIGDWVKADTPILHLKKRKEELEVALRKLLWKNTARLDAAKIREKKLKGMLETNRRLFKENSSISEEELIKLELEYYAAYYSRLELNNVKKQEKIAYELAKEALSSMTLNAPIDGIITDILLDEGETYRANEPLIRIVNPNQCYFTCDIEDRFSQIFKNGEEVILKFDGPSEKRTEKKGKVIFVSPVVDPASNLIKIKVKFDNSDNAINPGVTASMIKNDGSVELQ
jgi:RND family efflux transporter MFP subunit